MKAPAPFLLALVLLPVIARAEDAPPFGTLAGERWMGIYIRDRKAGWLHTSMVRQAQGESDRWVLSTTSLTRMTFLDRTLEVKTDARSAYSAKAPFGLLAHESSTETGDGKILRSVARDGDAFLVTLRRGRAVETRRAEFTHTLCDVLAGELLALSGAEAGTSRAVRVFLEEDPGETEGRAELSKVSVAGDEGGGIEVALTWKGNRQVASFRHDGSCIEVRIGPAVVLRTEEAAEAKRLGAGADLWALSHTEPLDRPLGFAPGRVARMSVEIEGVAAGALPQSGRQQVRAAPGGWVRVDIRRESPPVEAGPVPEALARYLASNARINADHAKIRETASRVAGEGGSPFERAERISAWVHGNIEKRPRSQGVSALDVLEDGAGDCTEHAVLCTALCRASGLPARVVTGLVYCGDETRVFGVHAWVEAWCGSWVSLDPAWGQAPADATHVKLSEGMSPTSLLLYTGKIRVKVLEVETD